MSVIKTLPASRFMEPSEKLNNMVAWAGKCKHCTPHGMVQMRRSSTYPYELDPNSCRCLRCGQQYFMEISDLKAFEIYQRMTKEDLLCDIKLEKSNIDNTEGTPRNLDEALFIGLANYTFGSLNDLKDNAYGTVKDFMAQKFTKAYMDADKFGPEVVKVFENLFMALTKRS